MAMSTTTRCSLQSHGSPPPVIEKETRAHASTSKAASGFKMITDRARGSQREATEAERVVKMKGSRSSTTKQESAYQKSRLDLIVTTRLCVFGVGSMCKALSRCVGQ